MYCSKCGEQIADNVKFCTKCGNQIGSSTSMTGLNGAASKNVNKKNRRIGIIAVGVFVVAIALVIMLLLLQKGRSYEKTIELYVKGNLAGDRDAVEEMLNVMPEELIEKMLEEWEEEGIRDKEDLVDYVYEKNADYYEKYLEYYGSELTYSYEIIEEKDLSKAEVRKLQKDFMEEDVKFEDKISEAKEVTIELNIGSLYSKDTHTRCRITLIKLGRSWYLGTDVLNR